MAAGPNRGSGFTRAFQKITEPQFRLIRNQVLHTYTCSLWRRRGTRDHMISRSPRGGRRHFGQHYSHIPNQNALSLPSPSLYQSPSGNQLPVGFPGGTPGGFDGGAGGQMQVGVQSVATTQQLQSVIANFNSTVRGLEESLGQLQHSINETSR